MSALPWLLPLTSLPLCGPVGRELTLDCDLSGSQEHADASQRLVTEKGQGQRAAGGLTAPVRNNSGDQGKETGRRARLGHSCGAWWARDWARAGQATEAAGVTGDSVLCPLWPRKDPNPRSYQGLGQDQGGSSSSRRIQKEGNLA